MGRSKKWETGVPGRPAETGVHADSGNERRQYDRDAKMPSVSYRAIHEAHTGYVSHKMTHYPFVYDQLLKPRLDAGKPVRLLEIGVQNGGSLEIWKKYLPPGSEIHGVDINENCLRLEFPENVHFHLGSAASQDFMSRTFENGMFDIVIDDGSHVCTEVLLAFLHLFPRLAPGGIYIVEDLHTSYWPGFGGGFRQDGASIEFFKSLADTVNLDHISSDALQDFSGLLLSSPDFQAMIASVSFYDSVCAVTKFHAPKTEPFLSVLTGKAAPIATYSKEVFLESPAEAEKRFFPPWKVRYPYESWNARAYGEILSSVLQRVENMYCGSSVVHGATEAHFSRSQKQKNASAPQPPLISKYCQGAGVELGRSLHNAFGLDCPNIAPCDGVNFLHPRDLEDYRHSVAEQVKYGQEAARVDRVGDFRHIPVDSGSLDYIVSSYVIEHEPNPVAALQESCRALKEGGVFFCIFPKRNAEKSQDIFRSLTTLEELILAYETDRIVTSPPAEKLPGASASGWRGHYYVYSLQSMMRLVNWVNTQGLAHFRLEAVEETDSKIGNGHTIVLRKASPHIMQDADYSPMIESCIDSGAYREALLAAKTSLSFDFFQHVMLYAAATLSIQQGDLPESQEFYRQALVQNPECEAYRQEYHRFFGEFYCNPLP
jgi:SAM-dependent methyltransferase